MNKDKENIVNNILTQQAPSDRAGDGLSPLKPPQKKPRHSNSSQARGTEAASSLQEQSSFSMQAHINSQLKQGEACTGLQSRAPDYKHIEPATQQLWSSQIHVVDAS